MNETCYQSTDEEICPPAAAFWTLNTEAQPVCQRCLEQKLDLYYTQKTGRIHYRAITGPVETQAEVM